MLISIKLLRKKQTKYHRFKIQLQKILIFTPRKKKQYQQLYSTITPF